jgi:integral membrane sensor domain MASE1
VIQRLIAAAIGAIVTFVLLLVLNPADAPDPVSIYLTAAVGGAIGTLAWPLVAAIMARNRIKDRRDEEVQKEVQRQLAEQDKG